MSTEESIMTFEKWLKATDTVFAPQTLDIHSFATEAEIRALYDEGEDPIEWAKEVSD